MKILTGIIPPLATPFDRKGGLDLKAMKRNIKAYNRYGLSGYLALGSNGEYGLLSYAEKLKVVQAVREAAASGRFIMAGTGCSSTRETIELTKDASSAGADAALVITPYYYKSLMTREAQVNHFFRVADASPVPVFVYNMPASTGIDLDAETIVALSRHPNIKGVKDSGGNIVKLSQVRSMTDKGFSVIVGSGSMLLPALVAGASAGILALALVAPQQCLDIVNFFNKGKIEKARRLQADMIPVNIAVTSRWGVPALKEAMNMLGLVGGNVREPLLPASKEIKSELKKILKKAGVKILMQN